MNILTLEHLTIGYTRPHRPVLAALDLHLCAGELVCLIGPNGAGKSTLMRTIAGLQPPLAGRVLLGAEDVQRLPPPELARRLSLVLTERIDVGLLSAYSLVALGRHPYTDWAGRLTEHDHIIVQDAIRQVGAEALAARPVSELSDGERQKIMIARALAQQPQLMLLDEPTAFLDLPRRVETMALLRDLTHDSRRAVLLSTHDLDLALRSADRIWLISDGVLHIGAPEDLVLSGAFGRAFHSEGVDFDPRTGAFSLSPRSRGQVSLSGEGLRQQWTQRALERIGFTVVDAPHGNGTTPAVHITVTEDAWQLHHGPQQKTCTSLYALIQALPT